MKSRLQVMLTDWEALINDGGLACAISMFEIDRDIDRLRTSVTSRGLRVFTLDLPLLDDMLLQTLEHGYFVGSNSPFTAKKSKWDHRPKFLWGFWSRVLDVHGCLLENPCPNALASLRCLACLWKKLEVDCDPSYVINAVKDFHEIESQIPTPVLNWQGVSIDASAAPYFRSSFACAKPGLAEPQWLQFLQRLDRVAAILVSELPFFDSMSDNGSDEHGYFRHGRGAVSNRRGGEYKYSFPSWSDKLEGVFPFDWCSGQPLGSFPPSRREPPAKLAAVPKTAKGPRLIASEPVEHQWCQQKLFTFLDYHFGVGLIGKFVSLHDQAKSQVMVASASIDRSFCTIDLSSASDRISCKHIESLMRSNIPLLEAFHAVRTRSWTDGVVNKGQVYTTRKFTTMGSALTFPVQCLFFLAVTLASCGASSRKDILALVGKVRIFGDDIIAPNDAYVSVTSNLEALGLKVNLRKSFTKGYFRESCGADFWRGFDITPCKPKVALPVTPEEHAAVLDTSNNLHLKGWWRCASEFLQKLPHKMRSQTFTVSEAKKPKGFSGVAQPEGVPGPVSYAGRNPVPLKWDRYLHRWYSEILALSAPIKRVGLDDQVMLSEHFTRRYSELNPRTLGVTNKRKAKLALLRVAAI